MKKIFLSALVLLPLMLASCSRYQINVLSSTNSVKDEKSVSFIVENDSVKISYSFYGKKAPVSIQIFNKLNEPVYIDWNRSAAIVDGKAISYTNKEVSINGNVSTTTDSYKLSGNKNSFLPNSVSASSSSLAAVATLPQNLTFLPPHSQTQNVPLNIGRGIMTLPDSLLNIDQMGYTDQYTVRQVKVRSANFIKENSPFVFRSYLTLYVTNGNTTKPMTFQQEFYVSKLISTTNYPFNFEEFQIPRGDFFISSQKTGYGKLMTGVGVAAAAGAGITASAALTNNANN